MTTTVLIMICASKICIPLAEELIGDMYLVLGVVFHAFKHVGGVPWDSAGAMTS